MHWRKKVVFINISYINMVSIENLEQEIQSIKERNSKVELDKRWETSLTRKVSILGLTYLLVVIFFYVIEVAKPFVNAIVPALGFLLSTLTLPLIKSWWLKKQK